MIKNDKQLQNTKNVIIELQDTKKLFKASKKNRTEEEYSLGLNSFNSVIADLKSQVRVYSELKKGNKSFIHKPQTMHELPMLLISARIATMSPEVLAQKVRMKPEEIENFEKTDYEKATWAEIINISMALNISSKLKIIQNGKKA